MAKTTNKVIAYNAQYSHILVQQSTLSERLERENKPFLGSKWSVESSVAFNEELKTIIPLKSGALASFDSLCTNASLV